MHELQWIKAENLIIERRGGAGKSEAMPALAAELVRLHPDGGRRRRDCGEECDDHHSHRCHQR